MDRPKIADLIVPDSPGTPEITEEEAAAKFSSQRSYPGMNGHPIRTKKEE